MQIEPLCLWIALQHNAHIHLLCVRSNRDRRGNHKPFQSIPILFLAKKFQSTRPIRGATTGSPSFLTALDISIHVPHTGRDYQASQSLACLRISIHALHTGRDSLLRRSAEQGNISIHAPHAGRDVRRKRYAAITQ